MGWLRTITRRVCWGVLFCFLPAGGAPAQPVTAVPDADAAWGQAAADLQQADAFIWQVFSSQDVDRYEAAARTYLALLARLDGPLSAAEQAVLLKHLRPAAMILPEQVRAETKLDEALRQVDFSRLASGTGARLIEWWRRQDDLPATPFHERLAEHLARVVYASEAYRSETDVRGFDDRGEIYVRLGAPQRTASIRVDPSILIFDFRDAPPVSDVPENEFWVYSQVHDAAHYLFIRETKGRSYQLGEASDLLPAELRSGVGGGPRGRLKAQMLLRMMEEIYGQLALQHPSFGAVYDEVTTHLGLPYPSAGRPDVFASSTLARVRAEDMASVGRREEAVPPSHSGTHGSAEDLAVTTRWARFLDPDGTTRTELYWSLDARALRPSRRLVRLLKREGHEPSDEYLLSLSVAQRTADYQSREISRKYYLVPAGAENLLPVQSFVVRGDTGTYHLALQWDQHWIRAHEERGRGIEPGVRLKVGTYSIDTLQALDGGGRRLEMSDLKPVLHAEEGLQEPDTPYPFPGLSSTASLALYFELYHLGLGAGDQTHYTIEYEVTHCPGKGDERTAAKTNHTGRSRTAEEFIVLDLGEREGGGEVEITVRATDETTGRQVARSITFALEPL